MTGDAAAINQRIVLAGGGHAHLAVLDDWARHPWPGTSRVLVTPSRHTAYSGMLPGWMAGIYRADELLIDLAPLAERAGARLVLDRVVGLDAGRRVLALASGEAMPFDLASLATGGAADLSALGPRALPVKPVESFMAGWNALFAGYCHRADGGTLAVVGGGAGGIEIALAAEMALRAAGTSVVLVVPPGALLPGHAPAVRRRVEVQLARRGIAVCPAQAETVDEGVLNLADGSTIRADHVIAATGSVAPAWLAGSGLATTPRGFVAVGADLASTSHPAIFAAGDIVERVDRSLPRSGVHAVKAGPVLATNLRRALAGEPLASYQPGQRTLYLLATGERRAIASWGGLAVAGRAPWWLKDRIDRGFVARHKAPDADGRREDPWPE